MFGVAVLAAVFARFGGYHTGHTFVAGMNSAIMLGAAVVAAAAFAIPRCRRVTGTTQPDVIEPAPELTRMRCW